MGQPPAKKPFITSSKVAVLLSIGFAAATMFRLPAPESEREAQKAHILHNHNWSDPVYKGVNFFDCPVGSKYSDTFSVAVKGYQGKHDLAVCQFWGSEDGAKPYNRFKDPYHSFILGGSKK